jgi:hypothetical protein
MITTAHVYTTLFLHLGVLLVVTAYYTIGAALLPGITTRAAARFAARPWFVTIIGVAISIPWVVGSIVIAQFSGPPQLIGAMLLGAWIIAGLVGGAGIARYVGTQGSDRGRDDDRWQTVARGGFLIALTWALPFIGWLVVLPLSLAAGVGCLALSRGVRPVAPAPVPAPPIPA